MWYHFTLTVPAGTEEGDPAEVTLILTEGVIKWIGVGFPSGLKQSVKVRIYHFEHQIFPTNPEEPACWDGGIEGGEMHYPLLAGPYELIARGYSPTATKSHNLTVFINILPLEVAEPWRSTEKLVTAIKKVFGIKA